jgi:CRISPR-associated protein Csx16
MTTYFVSRHRGAWAWAAEEGIPVDRVVEHLDPSAIQPGDCVVGTLPINLAAAVCERGGRYFHLSLHLSRQSRGQELTPERMRAHGASIEEYRVARIGSTKTATEHQGSPWPGS